MAEKFPGKNRLGNGGDSDAHQFSGPTSALLMQAPGKQFLAGAGGAGDQNRFIGVGKGIGKLDEIPHSGGHMNDGAGHGFSGSVAVKPVGGDDHSFGLFQISPAA